MDSRKGRLEGKVALVTGAARGIGRGCALALAEDGADIILNDLQPSETAAATARDIEALGRRAIVYPADVSSRSQVEAMVAEIVERTGRLDILVANAYRSVREPFLEMSLEGLEQTLATTLFGAFHCSQVAARAMQARGEGGAIIFIGSVHAEHPFAGSTAYNMAKYGIDALAQTAAVELAPHRIHVNVIHPGWIDTPGERAYATEEEIRKGGTRIPWGRLGTPQEIGRVAAFLASDDASYITGAVIRADGALILGLR